MNIDELTSWGVSRQLAEVIENGFSYDEETGEVFFTSEDLDKLEIAYEEKINQLSNYVERTVLEAEAFKKSKQERDKNQKKLEKKAENIKRYIAALLEMNKKDKLTTKDHMLSFRKSTSGNVTDEKKLIEWINSSEENKEKYLKFKEPEISKKALSDSAKAGEETPGFELIENRNLIIK